MLRVLSAGLLALAVTGCTVEREFLDTDLFLCTVATECGEGWGCVAATPYAENFCAPAPEDCALDCDGVCTGGAVPLCLRPCAIAEDGTPGACPSDFRCVRTSVELDKGLCYPITTCDDDADCSSGEVCLTEYLRDLNPESTDGIDNLYCVPRADDAGAGCPAGSTTSPLWSMESGDVPICYPICTITDTRCPPAMACLTQLHQIALFFRDIEGPQCALGNYGLSCQDDSNCFVGKCLETGTAQGKICTVTCAEASRIAGGGGCESLVYPFSLQGIFSRLECDVAAPSADGTGLCTARYKTSFPNCTREPDGAYPCASGFDCRRLMFTEGGLDLCTRDCVTDDDCNRDIGLPPAQWLYECVSGICLFRGNDP